MPRGRSRGHGTIGLLFNCGYARTALHEMCMQQPERKKGKQSTEQAKPDVSANVSPDVSRDDSGPTADPQNSQDINEAHENDAEDKLQSKKMSRVDAKDVIRKYFYWEGCGLCDNDFLQTRSRDSPIDRYAKVICHAFNAQWVSVEVRKEYIETFCFANWQGLTDEQRKAHTITKCVACATQYPNLQANFPLKPVYILNDVENVLPSDSILRAQCSVKTFLKEDFAKFNEICSVKTGKPFAEIAINFPKQVGLSDFRHEAKRIRKETIKASIHEQTQKMSENALIHCHSQDVSMSSNERLRLKHYFNTPTPPLQRKRNALSPDQCNQFDDICQLLMNWPPQRKFIAAEIAREFGIVSTDASHKIKLLAIELKADIPGLQIVSKPKSTRNRFEVVDLAMPVPPNPKQLRQQEKDLLDSGVLNTGVPCAPLKVTRYKDGKKSEITAYSRKFPLLDLRKMLLQKQEKCMRLHTDAEIDEMSTDDIIKIICNALKVVPNLIKDMQLPKLKDTLKRWERTRTLWFWHDHSTLLSYGIVLVIVGVMYDPMIFFTDSEDHGSIDKMSVQEFVEQGEIHFVANCSSTSVDQAGLIPDRLACLECLSHPTTTSNGIEIVDKAMFFKGDKQAAWFEAGISRGGHYCCIMCNCHTSKFKDFAHASQCNFRSLNDIQQVALAGCFGKRAGVLKFYDDLTADQLRSELNLRGVLHIPGNKKDNLACLKNHLQGVVRVPSLLILNPTSDLQQLNLEKYCVLPFEPLHDLKSHINNVLQGLPKVIHSAALSGYLEDFFKKPKIYGSDLREAIIQVLYILIDDGLDNNNSIYLLVQSLVQICKISYSRDRKRSPKQCLQFYNVAFLHHELCVDILKSVKGNLHLHSMACHGPVQHEIICSRSTNTEGEERLFKQATPAANNTDHKVENLAESLVIRLQCKLLDKATNCHQLVASEHSRIQKAAKRLPPYRGSVFTKSFIQKHIKGFQAHLERISHFLLLGKGVWWLQDEDGNVRFTDGDQDPDFQPGGPELLHFREAGLREVLERAKLCWQKILDAKIPIPLSAVRTYTSDGSALDVTIIARAEETESDSTVISEFVVGEPSGEVSHLTASKEINGEDMDSMCESSVCEASCPMASTPLGKKNFPNTKTEEESVQEEECVQEEESCAKIDTCLTSEEPDPSPSADIPLKSTLAIALVKVLGFNSDIAELDKVRSMAKSKPHATPSEVMKHKTLARKLRKMVVQQMETIRAEMKQLEQTSSVATITQSGRYRVLKRTLSIATKVYSNLV